MSIQIYNNATDVTHHHNFYCSLPRGLQIGPSPGVSGRNGTCHQIYIACNSLKDGSCPPLKAARDRTKAILTPLLSSWNLPTSYQPRPMSREGREAFRLSTRTPSSPNIRPLHTKARLNIFLFHSSRHHLNAHQHHR